MKTPRGWNFGNKIGKILLGLVFAAMIGSMNAGPSFAEDNHGREGKHDNGRYENRGRGYDRDRRGYDRRVYRPYGYRERVYVAPPVVFVPPPLPGISILFPPLFFRP
jgi:hypothetical protein